MRKWLAAVGAETAYIELCLRVSCNSKRCDALRNGEVFLSSAQAKISIGSMCGYGNTKFLQHVLDVVPYQVHAIVTDDGIQRAEQPRNRNTISSRP